MNAAEMARRGNRARGEKTKRRILEALPGTVADVERATLLHPGHLGRVLRSLEREGRVKRSVRYRKGGGRLPDVWRAINKDPP